MHTKPYLLRETAKSTKGSWNTLPGTPASLKKFVITSTVLSVDPLRGLMPES